MKFIKLFSLCLLFAFGQKGLSQTPVLFENSFHELSTEQDKFCIYLDSIDKYLYRDIDLTALAMEECQRMIDIGTPISDSILFNYVLAQIYFQYSKADPLGAYKIIVDTEHFIESKEISTDQIGSFNYLKSFTYMSIGDLDAAQKSYYEQIELGKANKDTSTIFKSLYSLGQLYSDEKDYDAAIRSYTEVIKLSDNFTIRPSALALAYIELSEVYINLESYAKALELLDIANGILTKDKLEVLKSDVLLLQGNVYLKKNQIDSAEYVHQQLVGINLGSQDLNNISNTERLLCDLYLAKEMYPEALKVCEGIMEKTDSSNLDVLMISNKHAHEICEKMKDFESSYEYLLAYNDVKDKKEEDVRRQKTAYLKIKYDSEEKEKENVILAAELSQNKMERKLLYTWMGLLCLFLVVLFGAFYQKGRYSKKLEVEVLKRTVSLKKSNSLLNKSNKELDEFNRILSHDLKEPLRSIIGFSQLAGRDITDPAKAREHLRFVEKGGMQLSQLIEDVSIFRNSSLINSEERATVNLKTFFEDMADEVQEKHPGKHINLVSDADTTIIGSIEPLKLVFKNLIDNGAKYNEQKVVQINVRYEHREQTHFFEIEDNGIGISKKYHERVFEMFKRLHNRDTLTGSGLGLNIVQKMIEKMDGEISILRSVENEGTTFLISFPELTDVQKETVDEVAYS